MRHIYLPTLSIQRPQMTSSDVGVYISLSEFHPIWQNESAGLEKGSPGSVMGLFPLVLSRFLHGISPAVHKLASSFLAELGEVWCLWILCHPFPFTNFAPHNHPGFQSQGAVEFSKLPGHPKPPFPDFKERNSSLSNNTGNVMSIKY